MMRRCRPPTSRRTVNPTPFLRDNARWLVGGFALTFFSSFGQTFFIALFAADIRAAHALSHGDFGVLYMGATLASAATLVVIGRVVDVWPPAGVASVVVLALIGACLLMASARSVLVLGLAIYLLRLFGQGMMSHTAMTAMGRWFVAGRGRAVSITATGHQLGEGVLPLVVTALAAFLDWRTLWVAGAVLLAIVALPLVRMTLLVPRVPSAADTARSEVGPQWTRADVLRDGAFRVVMVGVLAPAFIGTSVFFHQVHLAEIKGWSGTLVAGSFAVMSIATVVCALAAGRLIDRIGARRLLPFFLLPLALGCALLAVASAPATLFAFMTLLGVSYGISSSVFGAIWPELYGSRHLGAVRSVVFAGMVFASALGPGLTGSLIDRGVGFETQLLWMAFWCGGALIAMTLVSRRLGRREAVLPIVN